ncbi:MAG TPA: metallophosphoesterase [Blastocatellia bacterium]|nr:metallophosphoesterase [Blastocatellia bacterium]
MARTDSALITRRQAIASLATLATGTLLRPTSVFGIEPPGSKTRFAVLGDFGTGESDEYAVAAQMLESHQKAGFEFVLAVGDNIYPNGSAKYFVSNFEKPFEGLLKEHMKFYAVLGNHDVEAGRKDQLNYPLFNMDGSNYYMISRGNGLVDFFMLDSTACDAGQVTWLEKSLRDSRAIWKVAAMHHPIYSSGKKHGSETKLRSLLEPLFTRYHVQVVFAGHDHVYERTKPQHGIQYFITGAGGKMRRGDIDVRSPLRAASFDQDNSFMLIELDENEMVFKSVSEKGEIVDSGIIRQAISAGAGGQSA